MIMKRYIKDNNIKLAEEIIVNKDGFNIINPSDEDIIADGWKEYVDPEPTQEELLEKERENKLYEINEYDKSINVNNFTYNGISMWFPKNDRVGLRNSLTYEKENGSVTSTMWFDDIPLEINIDEGLELLKEIELYALACYNITASHRAEVKKMKTIDEIKNFDVTQGYPQMLNL